MLSSLWAKNYQKVKWMVNFLLRKKKEAVAGCLVTIIGDVAL